jgi:hypothetical protein
MRRTLHAGLVSLFDPDARPLDVEFTRAPTSRSARTLQRQAASGGDVVRVRAGAFADANAWQATSSLERYRARIRAVISTRSVPPVLCRESAAAMWGIPRLGRWPDAVHLADVGRTRPRSRNGVVWHQDRLDASEVVELEGVLVTDLVRTLVDLARVTPFLGAVVSLDYGMRSHLALPTGRWVRGASQDELTERLDALASARGRRTALAAIAFGDGASDSVGESLSRGQMHVLGFPPPRLQVKMPRYDGHDDIVDFDWPEFGLFGEFDGRGKYLRGEYTRGRTVADIVIAEKEREDRIRRRHRPFAVRWDWRIACRAQLLARRLEEGGLRRRFR